MGAFLFGFFFIIIWEKKKLFLNVIFYKTEEAKVAP